MLLNGLGRGKGLIDRDFSHLPLPFYLLGESSFKLLIPLDKYHLTGKLPLHLLSNGCLFCSP